MQATIPLFITYGAHMTIIDRLRRIFKRNKRNGLSEHERGYLLALVASGRVGSEGCGEGLPMKTCSVCEASNIAWSEICHCGARLHPLKHRHEHR